MEGGKPTDVGVTRRQFVGSLAVGAAGAIATTGVASARGKGTGKSDKTYYLKQGWDKIELTPLKGEQDPAESYDWDTDDFSSKGTTELQRPDTSVLFLYEDPDGAVHLVLVHGKYDPDGGDWDGGSVTFDFLGLSHDGSWVVQDDLYDGSDNYDNWTTGGLRQTVDWTWDGARTDGGVYGPLGWDPFFRIDPAFNENAELYEEYYEGDIDEWEVLSGDIDDPERHSLDTDGPVNIFHNPITGRDHDGFWDGKGNERNGRGRRHGNGRKRKNSGEKHGRSEENDGGLFGGSDDDADDDGWW